ncbi:MAG: hypothetical protein AB8B56_11710 [Crocinitomicaceae bacterium]
MKKFIAIYNTPVEAAKAYMESSAEEKQEGMQAWLSWKANNENHIVDFGAPLMPGEVVNEKMEWSQSDSLAGGYSILQAASFDELKGALKDHPHTAHNIGASIEIKELVGM